jgi:hypothetical protein
MPETNTSLLRRTQNALRAFIAAHREEYKPF